MEPKTINIYDCPTGCHIITKDVHSGVTPMMKNCPECGKTARSRFYNVSQELDWNYEWYAPEFPERLRDGGLREYCKNGGLLFRKRGEGDQTQGLPPVPDHMKRPLKFSELARRALRK